ncbi:hypothetical protein F0562_015011 [Nyssa sinensis]|uniref:DUF7722 domain-containing protein n=1 Tax=Nyssa sinensis TaxID=561372 RepID=A0A5J4ZU79_9ASTE|nr:hypothetical protein F0562_015011 [Nyssa sinensis]
MSGGGMETFARAAEKVGGGAPIGHHTKERCGHFQMPLHYPRFTRAEYETMPEWKLDCLLAGYGLPIAGDVNQKRKGGRFAENSEFCVSIRYLYLGVLADREKMAVSRAFLGVLAISVLVFAVVSTSARAESMAPAPSPTSDEKESHNLGHSGLGIAMHNCQTLLCCLSSRNIHVKTLPKFFTNMAKSKIIHEGLISLFPISGLRVYFVKHT